MTSFGDGEEAKHKRVACELCRRRKLKCDGVRTGCSTCTKLQVQCVFTETRKKSGPKRGYVKTLEARIAQMESKLKDTTTTGAMPDVQPMTMTTSPIANVSSGLNDMSAAQFSLNGTQLNETMLEDNSMPMQMPLNTNHNMIDTSMFADQQFTTGAEFASLNGLNDINNTDFGGISAQLPLPSFDLIPLGLEEAMPDPQMIEDLNRLFFEKIHHTMPMLHEARFMASMGSGSLQRPPTCLLYAIWALAASVTDGYEEIHHHLYERARKYIQKDEMSGDFGFGIVSLSHCQTWTFLSAYEFRHAYFPRAFMSIGRSARIAVMMGLHLNKHDLTARNVPTPSDYIEQEQRRRTFWLCYVSDRCASGGSGWASALQDEDITVPLPSSDAVYESGFALSDLTLKQALKSGAPPDMPPLAGSVVTASLLGTHANFINRTDVADDKHLLDGAVWKQHRALDKTLGHFALSLPSHLRIPQGINDSNVIIMTVILHTSTISLHRAAIVRAEAHNLSTTISAQSKMRCIVAAQEIVSLMRLLVHKDLRVGNPFLGHNLFVAATVLIQYLKARPNNEEVRDSLSFLVRVLQIMGAYSRLADAFLMQLEVHLVGMGLEVTEVFRDRWQVREIKKAKEKTNQMCQTGVHVLHSVNYDIFGPDDHSRNSGTFEASKDSQLPVRTRDWLNSTDDGCGASPGPHLSRIQSVDSPSNEQPSTNSLHHTSSRVSSISLTPPSSMHGEGKQMQSKGTHLLRNENSFGDGRTATKPTQDPMLEMSSLPATEDMLLSMTDADFQQMMDTSMTGLNFDATPFRDGQMPGV